MPVICFCCSFWFFSIDQQALRTSNFIHQSTNELIKSRLETIGPSCLCYLSCQFWVEVDRSVLDAVWWLQREEKRGMPEAGPILPLIQKWPSPPTWVLTTCFMWLKCLSGKDPERSSNNSLIWWLNCTIWELGDLDGNHLLPQADFVMQGAFSDQFPYQWNGNFVTSYLA